MSFYKLMRLQGQIKMRMISAGVDEDTAHDLASEVLHLVATSDLINIEMQNAYLDVVCVDD